MCNVSCMHNGTTPVVDIYVGLTHFLSFGRLASLDLLITLQINVRRQRQQQLQLQQQQQQLQLQQQQRQHQLQVQQQHQQHQLPYRQQQSAQQQQQAQQLQLQQLQQQQQQLQQATASNAASSSLPDARPSLLRGESSDMFWNSVDMGDLEPTPLSGSLEDQAIPTNLDAGGGDFDMPVEDFFDLDPFPLDGMPLDGEDWVSQK